MEIGHYSVSMLNATVCSLAILLLSNVILYFSMDIRPFYPNTLYCSLKMMRDSMMFIDVKSVLSMCIQGQLFISKGRSECI